MANKREEILSRIFALIEALPESKSAVRNRGLMAQDNRPGLALLDGDEFARLTGDKKGRQRMSPQIMEMRPQIFIVMDNRLPHNTDLGSDINTLQFEIIRALATDDTLLNLIGTNGNIALIRAETDLKSGASVQGQMRLDFTITYVLDPYAV